MITERQSRLYVDKYLPRKDYILNKKLEECFKEISIEYSLKRNNLNPNNGSPNIFINKLKKRYTIYYYS